MIPWGLVAQFLFSYEEMGASYVTFFLPLQIEGCLKSTTLNYTGIMGQHPTDFGRLSVKT